MFAADLFLVRIELKNKLIFSGGKKLRTTMPIVVIAFIGLTLAKSNFKLEDILICIGIIPLAFIGYKAGITKDGFMMNSFMTPWDKIEAYSLEDKDDKYIVHYKSNLGNKRIVFKQKDKDEIRKYLLGINKLRYAKKQSF